MGTIKEGWFVLNHRFCSIFPILSIERLELFPFWEMVYLCWISIFVSLKWLRANNSNSEDSLLLQPPTMTTHIFISDGTPNSPKTREVPKIVEGDESFFLQPRKKSLQTAESEKGLEDPCSSTPFQAVANRSLRKTHPIHATPTSCKAFKARRPSRGLFVRSSDSGSTITTLTRVESGPIRIQTTLLKVAQRKATVYFHKSETTRQFGYWQNKTCFSLGLRGRATFKISDLEILSHWWEAS